MSAYFKCLPALIHIGLLLFDVLFYLSKSLYTHTLHLVSNKLVYSYSLTCQSAVQLLSSPYQTHPLTPFQPTQHNNKIDIVTAQRFY